MSYHPEILSLTLLAVLLNEFEAACSPAQCHESVLAAQIFSWDNNASSSVWHAISDTKGFRDLEVHSTCNYCNCPFFFLACISSDPGDLAVRLLHIPRG